MAGSMKRVFSAAAATLLLAWGAAGRNVLDLSHQTWKLENDARNISVPGKLPSHVHLDLLAAGKIIEPNFGLNDIDLRWVALSDWTYTSNIHGIKGLGSSNNSTSHTYLLFNGLDTLANISFCGQHVAATDNQFRQYSFNITNIVAACQPTGASSDASSSGFAAELRVHFSSAPLIAQRIASQPGQETWPKGVENIFEFPHRVFLRKEQSDFGWDWGPAFAPAGIWQKAWIHQLESAASADKIEVAVTNVALDIHRVGQVNNLPPDQGADWVLNASINVLGTALPAGALLRYTVAEAAGSSNGSKSTIVHSGNLTAVNNTGSVITGMATIPADRVKLWWPNGMGEQNLYNITIDVVAPGSGKSLASASRRTGFRTIVVNMEPISDAQIAQGTKPGNNWHFEINGHEFYAKGSNFVPPDAFWTRVTPQRLRRLLEAAVAGNQNMLRVWASGVYGPDALYDLADELGVLLWSEFEFGDALYPVDAAFLENVREEAHYQVRRTVHHPSLAVWAGGNELENLELWLVNHSAPEQLPRYRGEYERLFLDVLLPAVYDNSWGLTYMPSSTNNGYLQLNARDGSQGRPWVPRYNNRTAGSIYGVTEWYNYDAGAAFNASIWPVGRFANEFGFHAMPSLATWREVVANDSELRWDSQTVVLRTHHPAPGGILSNDEAYMVAAPGVAEMARAIKYYYPQPNKLGGSNTSRLGQNAAAAAANFSAWCHSSQVFQADWLRHQIFFYRAGSGRPERQLGALYWQLNDIWQAPTWATVDYSGRWKVGHYVTRDAYRPVIAATVYDEAAGLLRIYAVSDLWRPVRGTLSLSWVAWTGQPLNVSSSKSWWGTAQGNTSTPGSVSFPFSVGAVNSTLVATVDVKQLNATGGLDPRAGLLLIDLKAEGTPIEEVTRTITRTASNATLATRTYEHAVAFTPTPLKDAKLVDPGLTVRHVSSSSSNKTASSSGGYFEVQATKGTSIWTWLDLADDGKNSSVVVTFEDNGFTLRKGETRRVGYNVVSSGDGKDSWQSRVTIQSTWNDTQPV